MGVSARMTQKLEEIRSKTSENYRAPLIGYIRLCASFQIHRWIQTGVTIRKRSIQVYIGENLEASNLGRDLYYSAQPWNLTDCLEKKNNTASLLCYFNLRASFHSHLWVQTEIWQMKLKTNRTLLLYHSKLYATLYSHLCIQTRVTVRKPSNWGKRFALWGLDLLIRTWP